MIEKEIDLNKYKDEFKEELIDDWRPMDAARLRLSSYAKPKDWKKLSPEDPVQPNFEDSVYYEIYALTRDIKPELIVETGVQNGCTTELILGALAKNEQGELVSFDVGPEDDFPSSVHTWGDQAGHYVREELRDRWTYYEGDSKKTIPKFLKKLDKEIDIFHHDSDHSTEHIEAELDLLLPHMKKGGIVCMHDREARVFKQQKEGLMKHVTTINNSSGAPFDIWQVE